MRTTIKTAALAFVLSASAAAAQNIIVVTHGQANDPFWSVVKNGVDKAAEDTGATVSYRAPETFDMVQMGQLIDAAVNQEPDGLVVSIPDGDALGPSIERAVQAGIPVVSMNSGSDVSAGLGALLHVGQEEFAAGTVAGKKLAELGGTKAICVNQEVGNVALDQRCAGFAEGFGGEATVLPSSNDPTEVEAKVRAALDSDPEIDTIMALGAPLTGVPAMAAVESLGRSGEVLIGAFDLSPDFLQGIVDGKAAFTLDQQQFLQGYLPVVFLALNANYGLVPGGNVPSGPNVIDAEKAAEVIELSKQGIR